MICICLRLLRFPCYPQFCVLVHLSGENLCSLNAFIQFDILLGKLYTFTIARSKKGVQGCGQEIR
jgi:hypothetical protein